MKFSKGLYLLLFDFEMILYIMSTQNSVAFSNEHRTSTSLVAALSTHVAGNREASKQSRMNDNNNIEKEKSAMLNPFINGTSVKDSDFKFKGCRGGAE